MPNISKSKDSQTKNFDQLIEHDVRNSFLQNHAENEAGRLIPGFFLVFSKALKRGLGIVAAPHFLHGFSGKVFFISNSIN